jgi:PKD repeat protein
MMLIPVVAFLCLALAPAGASASGAPPGIAARVTTFTEIPGIREFSSRLIARPLQAEALAEAGMSAREIEASLAAAREEMSYYEIIHHVRATDEYVFKVPAGLTENGVARRLMDTGLFQYVEPDWIVYPVACPDDPRFGNQWHHQSNRMQSCAGWDIHTGSPSVGVGICDTGVLTSHEDLQLHRLEGYNAVDRKWETQGGNIGPVHPHGTNTTGCAAANGNNGVGVSGVGWNLSHRMLRVSNSPGGSAYLSDLQHAARTSIEAGDRVASVSYSGADANSNLTTATYIKSIGGLLVWAAGNDGRYLSFGDRDADDLIVVGATDQGDGSAWFSAWGPFVDLTAPGTGVLTTDASSNSSYAAVDGTSFSTPLTAGLIGLIWSADGTLTPDQVEGFLKQGCDDLGSGGVDNTFGYGRINVLGSLSLVGGGGGGGNPPTADFSGTPTSGTAPLTVSFTDLSTGNPTSWSWDFGDGGSSTAQNPNYTYDNAGTYTVTLTVSNADGSDTMVRTNYITVNGGGGGGFTGEGFILSRNPDFSTDDRTFTRSETIYMLVWSDQVDFNSMRKAEWELRDANKNKVKQGLTNNFDNSFTASFNLSGLPSNATDWQWKGKIEDNNRTKYNPRAYITVMP